MQPLDWDDLRYLLAAARQGALKAAALTLGVDATTLGRRIARAEAALGSKLFHRAGAKLLPTETGQAVLQRAERMEAEVAALGEARDADARASGVLRLTAIPLLANRLLAPAVPALLKSHPLLRLELISEPRNLSLTKRDADMALRMARPAAEPTVIARRLCDLPYGVYAAARSWKKPLPWIAHEDSMAHLDHAAWIARAARDEGAAALSVNDSETMLAAVQAGVGKSLLPCLIADRTPGLARIGGKTPVLTRELWLLTHPGLQHLARAKAVAAWITALVTARSPTRSRAAAQTAG